MPEPLDLPYETRTILFTDADGDVAPLPLEMRALSTPDDSTPPGYDAYYLTHMTLDDRGTAFQKGAGKKTLRERLAKAPVLWNHDWWGGSPPIGRHIEGEEDDRGALVRVALADTTLARDIHELMKTKVPLGMSFGLERMADRSGTDSDVIDRSVAPDYLKNIPAKDIRIITEYKLVETSPVTFASNPKAGVVSGSVRSMLSPDAITTLLAKIRAGSLDAAEVAEVERIVAAWTESRSAADGTDAPIPDHARRFSTADLELMFLPVAHLMESARA